MKCPNWKKAACSADITDRGFKPKYLKRRVSCPVDTDGRCNIVKGHTYRALAAAVRYFFKQVLHHDPRGLECLKCPICLTSECPANLKKCQQAIIKHFMAQARGEGK